jgi:hypothetical protein
MPIVQNKVGSTAVIRCTANETFTLANLQVGSETVTGLGIMQVYFAGDWTVARGSNTKLVLNGQDNWIFDGVTEIKDDSAGTLVITNGTNPGTLIVVVRKFFSSQPEYMANN